MSLRPIFAALVLPLGLAAAEGSASGPAPLVLSYGNESLSAEGPRDPQVSVRAEWFVPIQNRFHINGTNFRGQWDSSNRYHVGVRLHDGGNDLWAWSVGLVGAYERNIFSDQPVGSLNYEGIGGGMVGSFGIHVIPEHLRKQVDVTIEPSLYAGMLKQDGDFVIPEGPAIAVGEIGGLRWDLGAGVDASVLVWRHLELTLGAGYLMWWVNPDESLVLSPIGPIQAEVDNDNSGGFIKLGAGFRF